MGEHHRQRTGSVRWIAWRLARGLADVRPGEGALVAMFTANVFLLLCGYYILKTVREGLILTGGMFGLEGDELKIYAAAAQALLLLVLVPAYGLVASRVRRIRLINITTIGFIASLVLFFALAGFGVPLGLPFYLWLGIFNLLAIAQFWSFANDAYDPDQGERLFAVIAVGGALGAVIGPPIASVFAGSPFWLMLAAAAALALSLALYNLTERRVRWRRPARPAKETGPPIESRGGFELVLRSRYLLLIAGMLVVANLVNTTGEYILANQIRDHAQSVVPSSGLSDAPARAEAAEEARRSVIQALYGRFYGAVNLLTLGLQAFAVSRVFKYVGVRAALFVLPVIAFGGYAVLGVATTLAAAVTVKLAENSTDYSLQNTLRQALFLPTSRAEKYKAKAAIDTFFVRFGDTAAAIVVAVGLHVLSLTASGFAVINAAIAAAWGLIAFGIARRYRGPRAGPGESTPPAALGTASRAWSRRRRG